MSNDSNGASAPGLTTPDPSENVNAQGRVSGSLVPDVRATSRLTARMRRALRALVTGPQFREQLDNIAGVSNSPALVGNLRRHGLGHHLECELIERIDRDGRTCRPGLYSLTPQGREIALGWIGDIDGKRA